MKIWRKVVVGIIMAVVTCSIAACGSSGKSGGSQSAGSDLENIKQNGVLKVGCKEAVAGFGYMNPKTNEYEGLEIDLAKKIADEIGVKVEFTPVTSTTRGQLLDAGEIDMVAATFTITDERKMSYDFSDPYYTDSISVLVKKGQGYKSLDDFDGKKIAIISGGTTKEAIENNTKADIEFVEYIDYADAKLALTAGTVDGFAVDVSILSYYVDDDCEIIADRFSPQAYGIATRKGSDLTAYVNDLVKKWKEDGTIDQMISDNGVEPSYEE